jgi:hypothetical protein
LPSLSIANVPGDYKASILVTIGFEPSAQILTSLETVISRSMRFETWIAGRGLPICKRVQSRNNNVVVAPHNESYKGIDLASVPLTSKTAISAHQ